MSYFKKEYNISTNNINAYRNGYKRCSECEFYILDVSSCPCCGDRLRTKPRNNKSKRLFNEAMK